MTVGGALAFREYLVTCKSWESPEKEIALLSDTDFEQSVTSVEIMKWLLKLQEDCISSQETILNLQHLILGATGVRKSDDEVKGID